MMGLFKSKKKKEEERRMIKAIERSNERAREEHIETLKKEQERKRERIEENRRIQWAATMRHYAETRPKRPMKPFDFSIYEKEKEQGEKLVCSVCGQMFATLEQYQDHHYKTCPGRGA